MDEKTIRESVRAAIKEMTGTEKEDKDKDKDKKDKFVPEDMEHLSENRNRLNEELMRRWVKKGKQ